MNILHDIQQLGIRHSCLEKDATVSDYTGNKSAFRRAKAEARALAQGYKELYKQMLVYEKEGLSNGNERTRKVQEMA